MAFCSNCGTHIADDSAFCPNCGRPAAPAGAAPPDSGPPAPVTAAPPIQENLAGALAYFTIIPAIILLLVEPYNHNRFVRFHALQCLLVTGALIVIDVALSILSIIFHLVPGIGWFFTALMWPLYSLAILALWLLLVVKAYQHEIFKLPVIGDMAEKQAAENSAA